MLRERIVEAVFTALLEEAESRRRPELVALVNRLGSLFLPARPRAVTLTGLRIEGHRGELEVGVEHRGRWIRIDKLFVDKGAVGVNYNLFNTLCDAYDRGAPGLSLDGLCPECTSSPRGEPS